MYSDENSKNNWLSVMLAFPWVMGYFFGGVYPSIGLRICSCKQIHSFLTIINQAWEEEMDLFLSIRNQKFHLQPYWVWNWFHRRVFWIGQKWSKTERKIIWYGAFRVSFQNLGLYRLDQYLRLKLWVVIVQARAYISSKFHDYNKNLTDLKQFVFKCWFTNKNNNFNFPLVYVFNGDSGKKIIEIGYISTYWDYTKKNSGNL